MEEVPLDGNFVDFLNCKLVDRGRIACVGIDSIIWTIKT